MICTQHAQAASEMSIVNFTATIASETKSVASAPAFPIHYIGMPHGTRSMLELMAEMTDTLCQLRSYLHISSLSRHREPATTGQLSARLSENAWIEGRTKSDGNKGEHREVRSCRLCPEQRLPARCPVSPSIPSTPSVSLWRRIFNNSTQENIAENPSKGCLQSTH